MVSFILTLSEKVISYYWDTIEVKKFIVEMLKKYAKSTNNDIDDILVSVLEAKLLK